jgi:hypothetical protein
MKKCALNKTATQNHLEGAQRFFGSDRSGAQGQLILQINSQLKDSRHKIIAFCTHLMHPPP